MGINAILLNVNQDKIEILPCKRGLESERLGSMITVYSTKTILKNISMIDPKSALRKIGKL
jgi:hypothetical protein